MKRKTLIKFNLNLNKIARLVNENSQKITRLNNKKGVIKLLQEYDSNSGIKWGFVLRWVLMILGFLLSIRLIWFMVIFYDISFVWTGFGEFQTPNGEFIRGKTLWDWMELVLIPLVLFFGAHYFTSVQRRTELEQTKRREQANILQNYFDRMQDLILNHDLLNDKTNDAVTVMALVLTRTTLAQLEPENKSPLLQFLDGTKLIVPSNSGNVKLSLSSTNLVGVGLPFGYVNGNFQGTDFKFANMKDARFDLADFRQADLMGVHLESASLMLCDLSGANLEGAFLKGANFYNSTFSEETIMPNGENWYQDIDWKKFGIIFKDPYTDDEYNEILRELGHEH